MSIIKYITKLVIPIFLISGCYFSDLNKGINLDKTYSYNGKIRKENITCTGEDSAGILIEVDKSNKKNNIEYEYYAFNHNKRLDELIIITNNQTNSYINDEYGGKIIDSEQTNFINYLNEILKAKRQDQ